MNKKKDEESENEKIKSIKREVINERGKRREKKKGRKREREKR